MDVVRDLGYALLYVGFGGAIGVVCFAVPRALRALWDLRPIRFALVLMPSPPSPAASVAGAIPFALFLPFLRGTAPDGSETTLIGLTGLDAASVAVIITGALTVWMVSLIAAAVARSGRGTVGREASSSLRLAAVWIAAGVNSIVAGNLLIQLALPEGSRVVWGFWAYELLVVLWLVTVVREWQAVPPAHGANAYRPAPPRYRPRNFDR